MQNAVDWLDGFLPLWLAEVFVILGLFIVAYVVSRLAGRVGGWLLARRSDDEPVALYRARQRETLTGLARTTVSYVAYGLALVLAIVAVSGTRRIETIAGASFVAVILAFAVQRFLVDIVAGGLMIFERWFAVGDLVSIEPWNLLGVVEEISLRSIKLRSVQGEVIRVSNSQVLAVRVIPRGLRQRRDRAVRDRPRRRPAADRTARARRAGRADAFHSSAGRDRDGGARRGAEPDHGLCRDRARPGVARRGAAAEARARTRPRRRDRPRARS